MDSLFHFIFPIIIAIAARVRIKDKLKTLISLGLLSILLDIDHLSPVFERALFHNIFIVFLIPSIILLACVHYKLNNQKKKFVLLLMLFLSSHVVLDIFTNQDFNGIAVKANLIDGVALIYPLSNLKFSVDFNVLTPSFLPIREVTNIATTKGLGIMIFFITVFAVCVKMDGKLRNYLI